MTDARTRQSAAYWLTLAFRLEGVSRSQTNTLVLTASRRFDMQLMDLVRSSTDELPPELAHVADVHAKLIEAEGRVSAQAFLVDRLIEERVTLLPIAESGYPRHVATTLKPARAPTLLAIAGDVALLEEPGVAVSGSRRAGPQGIAFARAMGAALASVGIPVVSGLAAGVDRAAMEGCLEAGGRVIGIAAEGILNSRVRKRREVAEGRLVVVSEFAPDDGWAVGRAMARNRTIAGFSRALVIADCVSSGGTTDQLEVHRGAGLPVFVRRGPGEGKLVAELARRRGVRELRWSAGAVLLPPELGGKSPAGASCSVTWSDDRVSVHVEGPRQLELAAVLDAVRDEWERAEPDAAVADSSSSHTDAVHERPAQYGRARAESQDDLVIATLPEGEWTTRAELEKRVELSKSKLTKRLRELEDAGLVEIDRTQRAHRFRRRAPEPKTKAAPRPSEPSTTGRDDGDMGPLFADVQRG